jgi:uncharacterized RDD family membrane protein YckC
MQVNIKTMKKNQKKIAKKNNEVEYASFHARAIAALIDCLLMALAFMPLFYLTNKIIFGNMLPIDVINSVSRDLLAQSPNGQSLSYKEFMAFIENNQRLKEYFITNHGLLKSTINQIIQLVSIALVIIYFWIKKQATPGKMCLSLKIVDANNLGKPSNKQLISRMLGYIVSTVPLLLGIIWISFDPRKQGWHDKIANTVVIKNKKQK